MHTFSFGFVSIRTNLKFAIKILEDWEPVTCQYLQLLTHMTIGFGGLQKLFGTEYSKMGQVKYMEDSLKEI